MRSMQHVLVFFCTVSMAFSSTSSSSEDLLSPPGPKSGRPRASTVWDYFSFDPMRSKSVCLVQVGESSEASDSEICGTEFSGKFPTNLKAHLKKNHPRVFQEFLVKEGEKELARKRAAASAAAVQPTIAETILKNKPYERGSARSEMITRKLAVFIGAGHVANRLVDCEEFRELLAELDPRYVVPSRAVIDKEMTKVLIELKGKVSAKIKDSRKVSICVDVWTKKGMTEAFLGITAHFFTRTDHRRRVATLAVKRFQSPHTADRIEEEVRCILEEWEIPQEKTRAILTDNGSNVVAAFRDWLLVTQEEEKDLEEEEEAEVPTDPADDSNGSRHSTDAGSDVMETGPECSTDEDILDYDQKELSHEMAFSLHKRLSCFTHTLQLVICKFDTLKSPKKVIRSAHRIVAKFNKSVKATEKLVALCGKKLVSACPTRWNSTFLMISRMLEVRPHMSDVMQELEWDNLPHSEWKVLENMYELLRPFARYTALTSAEETTTISMIVPVLMELEYHLKEMKDKPGIRQLATVLLGELSRRFEKVLNPFCALFEPIYVEATLLDPRFKIVLTPNQLEAAKLQLLRDVSSRAEAMLQQLHKDKDIVASNAIETADAVRFFFERMQQVLSQREKALLSTVHKYGDIKLTRLDTHHQKLREHHKAILQVVDKIEKMIQNGENVNILLQKQAISEELDVHQQSVLSIGVMLTESQSSSRYLSFKEDNSLCHQMTEVGTLNECHRDPDSPFLSVRRLIVSEDEDPYLDVPLRFEDEEASAPQKTMRFDETKQPLEFTDQTYDTPRPLTPPRARKLPTPLSASPHIPTSGYDTYDVPTSSPKYPPTLPPRNLPPLPPGYDTYDVPTSSPKYPPTLPPRNLPPLPPRYPPNGDHSVPKAATLPARRTTIRSFSFPEEPSKPSEMYVSDQIEEGSDEEYEPLSLPPVPRPRVKPPPIPPDHPSRGRKPVPVPRRRLVTSPGELTALKRSSRTLPSRALCLPLSPPPVEPAIIQPILVIGNDQLSWPFSHETVYPCGVCCTSVHDTLIVSDVFNHCVRLIDKKGTFIEKIGREGREGGQFKEPSAVAITDDNHILVAERDNPRVQKFTTMGKYLMKFGQKALWGSQLSDPLGIAVADNRNIFITDWDRSRVFVYQNNGKFVKMIGKDDEFFKSPAGIVIDRLGRLLITDRYNHCVWVLTPDGELVSKIGSQGSLPGQLFYPYGITVTENGSIVVTESGNNRISVFSQKGELIRCFGKAGSEPGMFNHPRHVCVNSKGHIIVADEMNQRIQVFQLL